MLECKVTAEFLSEQFDLNAGGLDLHVRTGRQGHRVPVVFDVDRSYARIDPYFDGQAGVESRHVHVGGGFEYARHTVTGDT